VPASPTSPQPPTSFLDLPDETLHSIFEEVYEERYESITSTTPLRIAEILVNKRIYSLARPLWYKRLSINEQQLDVRLAGLLGDATRASQVSELVVSLTNSHVNLAKLAISRVTRLFSITVKLTSGFTDNNITLASQCIMAINPLRDLTISSSGGNSIGLFWSTCASPLRQNRNFRITFEVGGVRFYAETKRGTVKRYEHNYSEDGKTPFKQSVWKKAHTFDLGHRSVTSNELLETLIETLKEKRVGRAILRRKERNSLFISFLVLLHQQQRVTAQALSYGSQDSSRR